MPYYNQVVSLLHFSNVGGASLVIQRVPEEHKKSVRFRPLTLWS